MDESLPSCPLAYVFLSVSLKSPLLVTVGDLVGVCWPPNLMWQISMIQTVTESQIVGREPKLFDGTSPLIYVCATPRAADVLPTQTIYFGTVQFKHHHQRNSKTPVLACGVQWYGWLGRHPRAHAIFFGIVRFKHTHPRGPKTQLLARGVQWYGCLGRHPRTHSIFFGMVPFKDTHPRDPKASFLACGV